MTELPRTSLTQSTFDRPERAAWIMEKIKLNRILPTATHAEFDTLIGGQTKLPREYTILMKPQSGNRSCFIPDKPLRLQNPFEHLKPEAFARNK